jgi:hypothetical protein
MLVRMRSEVKKKQTDWQAVMLRLPKYSIEMTSDGKIFIPSFMTIGWEMQVTLLLPQQYIYI